MQLMRRGQGKRYIVLNSNESAIKAGTSTHGVLRSHRYLTTGNLRKNWGLVKKVLHQKLELTPTQVVAVERLLRLWSYYGLVCPKAGRVAHEPTTDEIYCSFKMGRDISRLPGSYGCSRRTFWRTIHLLQERKLVEVVNRYLIREHAQISNLYLIDNLIILIARYLAEHGKAKFPNWISHFMRLSPLYFWSLRWAKTGTDPPHVVYT